MRCLRPKRQLLRSQDGFGAASFGTVLQKVCPSGHAHPDHGRWQRLYVWGWACSSHQSSLSGQYGAAPCPGRPGTCGWGSLHHRQISRGRRNNCGRVVGLVWINPTSGRAGRNFNDGFGIGSALFSKRIDENDQKTMSSAITTSTIDCIPCSWMLTDNTVAPIGTTPRLISKVLSSPRSDTWQPN